MRTAYDAVTSIYQQVRQWGEAAYAEAESAADQGQQDRLLAKAVAYGECRRLAGGLARRLLKEAEESAAEDRLQGAPGTCGDAQPREGL